MATRTAKLRVELDGEKKYKEAIAEINRESKTLGAEMKKLAAEYKGSEDSVEALTKKQTLLDRALLESRAKVEQTRKQLDSWRAALERVRQEQGASSDEYKAAQKKVQEYEYALANAETQELNLENAIRENNEALAESETALEKTGDAAEDMGGKTKTLGDLAGDLAGKFGVKLPDGLKKSLDGMKTFSTGTVVAVGAVTAAVTAAYKAYKALYDMTLEQAKAADELLTRSLKTGLDSSLLQQLDYASAFLDFDGMDQSLQKLIQSMDKARDGAKAQADAFAALGISVTNADGTLRDSWEVFEETIDALGRMNSEEEASVVAQELLGKSYADLKPLIKAGTDELKKYMDQAVETGYVLDNDQIKKLGEVDDAVEENRLMWEGLQKQFALEFAPTAKKAMETFTSAVQTAGQALVDSRLIENFGAVIEGVLGVIQAGTSLAQSIPGWMNPLKILSYQLALIADYMDVLSGLLPKNWGSGKARTALGLNRSSGQLSHVQQLKYGSSDYEGWTYNEELGAWNAGGNDNWRGGLTWVGEAGPELVSLPRGSQIYNAQDARRMGGDMVINVSVQNIEELSQLVRWYSGLQVRGRMA